MRISSAGHAVFAAIVITLGILCLVRGDFSPVWEPVPDVPGRDALVYVCAVVSLGTGVGLLLRRAAAPAARVLLPFLLLWMLVFRVRFIVAAPGQLLSYYPSAETAAISAGAWVLYCRFATDWDRRRLGFVAGDHGVRIARVLYGLALIPFGVAHFLYMENTAPLVPHWLPAPTFWAYFTGAAFLAASAGILLGVCARLAAALSAFQIGMFTVLVWIPIVAAGRANAGQLGEFVVSGALTAAGWLVAESYRGTPWLALNRR